MKKVIISGFVAIVSSIWLLAIGVYVQCNLVSEWYGNRFLESAVQLGVIIPLILSFALLVLSIVGLCFEYFRKDK